MDEDGRERDELRFHCSRERERERRAQERMEERMRMHREEEKWEREEAQRVVRLGDFPHPELLVFLRRGIASARTWFALPSPATWHLTPLSDCERRLKPRPISNRSIACPPPHR